MNILNLYDQIFIEITSFLYDKDIFNIAHTCRTWRNKEFIQKIVKDIKDYGFRPEVRFFELTTFEYKKNDITKSSRWSCIEPNFDFLCDDIKLQNNKLVVKSVNKQDLESKKSLIEKSGIRLYGYTIGKEVSIKTDYLFRGRAFSLSTELILLLGYAPFELGGSGYLLKKKSTAGDVYLHLSSFRNVKNNIISIISNDHTKIDYKEVLVVLEQLKTKKIR